MKALGQLQKLRPHAYPPLNERTPKVAFVTDLQVVGNGVVYEDEGRLKALANKVGVKGEDGKKAPTQEADAGVKPKKPGKGKGAKSGAAKSAGDGPATDEQGVPLPVEEGT
jgi:hypothetical protein